MLFLPFSMMLFTKRVTTGSLNLGSGARGIFLAACFLIENYNYKNARYSKLVSAAQDDGLAV
jgi:hypothetical protein